MRIFLLVSAFIVSFQNIVFSQVLGTPIQTWDFAEGIPSNWQSGITSTNNIAHWEYRGPQTTPNNQVGARGSCAGTALPLNSVTNANGFMIFDSNYWDDGDMECGGLGTGVDPAPHNAWMMTNEVNLTTYPNVVLTFQQQFRHYQTTATKVEMSVNGGVWSDILVNSGTQSPTTEWKSVNISVLAGGQPNVRFRFSFVGTYYWWLVDDINLYVPNQNDILLDWVGYTTNPLGQAATPYSDLQYDQYPSVMIPPFSFRAKGTNVGANTQTNARINARVVRNGTTQTYNSSSAGVSINPTSAATMIITPSYTNPATVGDYKIYYDILQNETDDNPGNDIDSLNYTISPYAYARDEGPMVNHYESTGIYTQWAYEIGNMFQTRAAGKQCHSLQVAIADGTQVGAQIRGYLYAEDMETLIAQTNIYTVNIADLNEAGEEKIVTLHFPNVVALTNGAYYMAMVGQTNANQVLKIARSGNSPSETSFVRYLSVNGNFYSTTTPIVRMNIFNAGIISGCMDATAMNYNVNAITTDGSCRYAGCTDEDATNFDPNANWDNGTCVVAGCMDPLADNYNPNATVDDGNCIFYGCTDEEAINFDPDANTDDGSCIYTGCTNPLASNYNPQATIDDGSCIILGCTDVEADNYNPEANEDDGSCIFLGCTDEVAVNYDPNANTDDGSCIYEEASFQLSTTSGCAPLMVTITNLSSTSQDSECTFMVNEEIVMTECVSNFSYTFEQPGTYQLTYVSTIGEFVSDTTTSITVHPTPEVPLISYSGINFEITCSNCGGNSIEWVYENAIVVDSSDATLNIYYEQTYRNGYYEVVVTEQENQCSSTSEPLFVLQPYFSLDNEEGCAPLSVEVTNLTDEVQGVEYLLDYGDGVTDENFMTTTSHQYDDADTYELTVIATSPLGIGSYTRNLSVHPSITPVLIHVPNDGLIVCENCDLFESVVWNIDGTIFNDFGPHTDGGINYTVTGTTEFGCEGSSTLLPSGVNDIVGRDFVYELYPNPANEYVVLSQSVQSPYELAVFDFVGREVYKTKVNTIKHIVETESWSPGIYMLRMSNGASAVTIRLTIAR